MLQTLIVLVVILVLLALANLVLLWRRGVVAPEVTATADTAEFERRMRDEFERARTSRESSAKELREEVSRSLGQASESMVTTIKAMAATQSTQLTQLQSSNEKKLEEMRLTVDASLQVESAARSRYLDNCAPGRGTP